MPTSTTRTEEHPCKNVARTHLSRSHHESFLWSDRGGNTPILLVVVSLDTKMRSARRRNNSFKSDVYRWSSTACLIPGPVLFELLPSWSPTTASLYNTRSWYYCWRWTNIGVWSIRRSKIWGNHEQSVYICPQRYLSPGGVLPYISPTSKADNHYHGYERLCTWLLSS